MWERIKASHINPSSWDVLISFAVGGGNNYVIETAIFNAFYLIYESDDVYGNHSLAIEGTQWIGTGKLPIISLISSLQELWFTKTYLFGG